VKRSALLVGTLALLHVAPAGATGDRPTVVSAADQTRPAWTRNCTALNRKYPHGVGRRRARDKTSGTPVTTFRRSTALYNLAMRHNRGLDHDRDGIACEKA
jgi:hypothetical protein